MYSADEPTQGRRHPLAKGASPEAIAAALLPEDRAAFLTEYAAALAAARDSLDLTGLFQMLEHWRRVAALQADPQVFRHVARLSGAITRPWSVTSGFMLRVRTG